MLEKEIGRGGFATVFQARDQLLARQVALKVLHSHESDKEQQAYIERFAHEAKSLAALDHPHVLRIYDVVMSGPHYLVTELLEGHSLEEQLTKQGPMPLARALDLLLPCLEGLQKAHQRDIIHKDIKPANLFLVDEGTPDERLVLLDFSAASTSCTTQKEGGSDRLTGKFELVGTLQYMAPEYMADQHLTPALDVYQTGLLLVEMLTGQPTVEASGIRECMAMHCRGLLNIPKELTEGPLGELLPHILAIDPEERLQDAAALAQALSSLRETDLTPEKEPVVVPLQLSPPKTTQPLWALTPKLTETSHEVRVPVPAVAAVSVAQPKFVPRWAWATLGAAVTVMWLVGSVATLAWTHHTLIAPATTQSVQEGVQNTQSRKVTSKKASAKKRRASRSTKAKR